jgi:hypothetical protein
VPQNLGTFGLRLGSFSYSKKWTPVESTKKVSAANQEIFFRNYATFRENSARHLPGTLSAGGLRYIWRVVSSDRNIARRES